MRVCLETSKLWDSMYFVSYFVKNFMTASAHSALCHLSISLSHSRLFTAFKRWRSLSGRISSFEYLKRHYATFHYAFLVSCYDSYLICINSPSVSLSQEFSTKISEIKINFTFAVSFKSNQFSYLIARFNKHSYLKLPFGSFAMPLIFSQTSWN